jgi:hypothetical protein
MAEKTATARDTETINIEWDLETLAEDDMAFAAAVEGRCASSAREIFAT